MKKLKVLDLFSGSGGFSVGLHNSGYFETVAFCEVNKRCRKTLNINFPEIPIVKDIKKLNKQTIERIQFEAERCARSSFEMSNPPRFKNIDVICGGFPCQDASTGNVHGKGIKGERTGLWKEYKRLIEELQPKYIIAENVPNLRNRGLGEVIQDLRSIGYVGRADIISARAFGAFHPRERLYILATHRDNYGFIKEAYAKSTEDSKRYWKNYRGPARPFMQGSEWAVEPNLDRVVHGIPYSLDINTRKRKKDSKVQETIKKIIRFIDQERAARIKMMGNAVYPPIVEWIGKQIGEFEYESKKRRSKS